MCKQVTRVRGHPWTLQHRMVTLGTWGKGASTYQCCYPYHSLLSLPEVGRTRRTTSWGNALKEACQIPYFSMIRAVPLSHRATSDRSARKVRWRSQSGLRSVRGRWEDCVLLRQSGAGEQRGLPSYLLRLHPDSIDVGGIGTWQSHPYSPLLQVLVCLYGSRCS